MEKEAPKFQSVELWFDKSATYCLKNQGEAYIHASLCAFNGSRSFVYVELAKKIMRIFGKDPSELFKIQWRNKLHVDEDGDEWLEARINYLHLENLEPLDIMYNFYLSSYKHQKCGTFLFVDVKWIKMVLDIKDLDEKVFDRIIEFVKLKDNWDGYGAIPIKDLTLVSLVKYLRNVFSDDSFYKPDVEDIYPTPYGSIVIDFETERGLVSSEIGNSDFGFFTDYSGSDNYGVEGFTNDFDKQPIPECIIKHITK